MTWASVLRRHPSIVVVMVLLVSFGIWASYSPSSVGFVVTDAICDHFALEFNHSEAFLLNRSSLLNGSAVPSLQSLRISGEVLHGGEVNVTLIMEGGVKLLVFTNKERYRPNRITSTGMVSNFGSVHVVKDVPSPRHVDHGRHAALRPEGPILPFDSSAPHMGEYCTLALHPVDVKKVCDDLVERGSESKGWMRRFFDAVIGAENEVEKIRGNMVFDDRCVETCDLPWGTRPSALLIELESGTTFRLNDIIYTLRDAS